MNEPKARLLGNLSGASQPSISDLQIVCLWSIVGLLLCELQMRIGLAADPTPFFVMGG